MTDLIHIIIEYPTMTLNAFCVAVGFGCIGTMIWWEGF